MPQPMPQFSGHSSPTSQSNGQSIVELSDRQRSIHSKNPFRSTDLEQSPHPPELSAPERSTPSIESTSSHRDEMSSGPLDETHKLSNSEGKSLQQQTIEQDKVDTDDRVFFGETGKVKWPAMGLYVFVPGAIGGAGRWIRQEVKLQNQPQPPVASNIWLSTDFYYSITLGLIAAIIGNFVLARLILKIDKNKLTYLGLSLIFGMFYSTVFAMGGQAVLSSEGKIDQNQSVAIASDNPEVQQQAIDSNQSIATSSDDPGVKEEAIEASEAIAIKSEDPDVQEDAIEASETIALDSNDSDVQKEAIEASEAIATSQTADASVQQKAIEASEAIAVNSDDPVVQEKAIDTTVAIFRDIDIAETATQIAAVQAIGEVAMDSPELVAEANQVREHALEQLTQLRTIESLNQSVIDTIDQVATDLQ